MKPRCAFLRLAGVLAAGVLLAGGMGDSMRAASVTFAWNPNSEVNLEGYKIHYGPAPRNYTTNITLGKVTTHQIANLLTGQNYYFAITAVNSNGVESDFSTELRYPPPPNLPPTIGLITDRTVSEDAQQQSVTITGISAGPGETQPLSVTATSSNPSVVPNPSVGYTNGNSTAVLRFTPAPNATGLVTITVTVDDSQSQSNTATETFTVDVQPLNDPPALATIANQSVPEDTAATFPLHVTDIDTLPAGLALSVTSSNTTLAPTNRINFSGTGTNRTMVVTPATNQSGTAVLTVTVSDGALTASRQVTLTVGTVPDAPSISGIADVVTDEDVDTGLISFTVSDPDTPTTNLTVRAISSNTTLIPTNRIILAGTNGTRTVRLRPTTNEHGSATITLTVSDGTLSSSTNFNFTVRPVNDTPTITQITDRTLLEDVQTNPLLFTVNDVETAVDSLQVTVTTSNPNIVPDANLTLGRSGTNHTIIVRPATNAVGSSLITLTVSDGQASASEPFNVIFLAVNDVPFVSTPPDLTVNKLNPVPPIPFTVWDVETNASLLTITFSSTNTTLQRVTNMVMSGTGTNRTLTLIPTVNQTGTSRLGISVSDGGATNTVFFQFTVTGSNNPPVLTVPGPLAGDAGIPIPVRSIQVADLDVGTNNLNFTLTAPNGTLNVSTSVTAGVRANQVSGNNSGSITIIAPLAALNATLANTNGIRYTSRPDFGGTETLVATVSDNGFSGTGGARTDTENIVIQVTGTTGDSLTRWRATYFAASDLQDPTKEATLWGDLADPDNDGRHNLMEFALGLNPLGSEPQEAAFISHTINSGGNQYLALTFNARINEPLLQYVPEVSSDNVTWFATAQRVAATPLNAEFERVTWQDNVPITSEAARFIRLRVVKNSP